MIKHDTNLEKILIPQNLPRLAYISDVPAEASYHGSMLLYRLLEFYPKDKLVIIETGHNFSTPNKRIPSVPHYKYKNPFIRLQFTRYKKSYLSFLRILTPLRSAQISSILKKNRTEAILSVAEGIGWMIAFQVAQKNKIPYHLIIHDTYTSKTFPNVFSNILQQANSCLCVSPFMSDEYRKQYRCNSTVLFPSRSRFHYGYSSPSQTTINNNYPLTLAFAGSIWKHYITMIKPIVEILKHYNGQFHIYGDATPETINASELAGYDNIHVKGYLPHAQLIDTLRNTSHVLYSPLAFLPEDDNMRLCFPSKLVDYTAVGLPIILHGPPYASQMRWATQYPDSFVTIDSMDTQAIERAILRLTDPATRHSLASNAIALGQKVFSWETAWKTFTHCLLNP